MYKRQTRGGACIDRIFVSFNDKVVDFGSISPLEVDPGTQGSPSDHLVAFAKCEFKRLETFEWLSYRYMYYNEDSVEQFGAYLSSMSWALVLAAHGSNAKAEAYQALVTGAMEVCFPVITTRRKLTELPWINNRIRRLVRQRRGVFRQQG